MRNRTVRVTHFLAGIVVAAVSVGGVVVVRALSAGLARAGVGPAEAADARAAAILALVLAGVAGVAAAAVLGWWLRRELRRVHVRVLALARGETPGKATMPHIRELLDVSTAVDRLSRRVADREADLERGGTETGILLDAISEGILQLDPDGRVVRANPVARTLLGVDGGSIGQPVTTHIRNVELRRILQQVAAGEPVDAAELNLDDRRLLVSGRPLPGGRAGGGGAVVAFVDLTEVRRLESVRRDFVANVSHELKTPLTSIRGYIETLMADDELPPDMRRQFLSVVHSNADRLAHIIDDLLDLSRLESGGWRPELREVDAAAAVEDVWSACSKRAAERGIRFVAPAATTTVRADPAGLRQVLANLLDNAMRYTPDGGRIEVRVSGGGARSANGRAARPESPTGEPAEAAGFVTFEVLDTGAGIPSDALPRIFERFYRVDPSRSRTDGGTGLGLAIVKHLVERMGGDVRAESELGRGTTIRFRLPAPA
jgi:two-component system, OmpR family, phosphate regulon sensor histidine kinase PhoR